MATGPQVRSNFCWGLKRSSSCAHSDTVSFLDIDREHIRGDHRRQYDRRIYRQYDGRMYRGWCRR